MKVLFIAYGYQRDGKSESLTAYNLVRTIRGHGHTTTVLTRKPVERSEGIHIDTRIWLISSPRSRKLKADYLEFITRARLVAKRLRGSYDLIHHISPISLRFPDLLGNLGVPFIWGPVGGSIDYPPGFESIARRDSFMGLLGKFDRLRLSYDPLMRHTLRHATRIVATSTAARNNIPEKYLGKSIVIPEGIVFRPAPAKALPPENYIFCSARFVPYKAVDLLIRAYGRCPSGETILWITGDGPERARLESLIKESNLQQRVKLLGRVPKDENMRLMAGARFCVFPALNEAFGHVNLEAMMTGKPVIVTDWGGPADIVKEGVTGFKVLGRDPDDHVELLARQMSLLLQDSVLCQRMGEQAREHVQRSYSWETIGNQYDELYRSVMTKSR